MVIDPPRDEFSGTDEQLQARIEQLTATNRDAPRRDTERELLRLRNLAGIRRLEAAGTAATYAEPDFDALPESDALPEIAGDALTPGLLRAGILRDGCLLVRGLIPSGEAMRLAASIDRSFAERERHDAGEPVDEAHYAEFEPDPGVGVELSRPWIKSGGGLLAVDAPALSFQMMELFAAAGLPGLVQDYLGEPAVTSAQKTTLRKAAPSVPGGWHQDGKFMGPVRSLNLWLALSRCGDLAPGLDIVPRRIDHHVTAHTDEAPLDYVVSQRMAEEAAGEKPILRPIFAPGDALFFDELFLHKTGSDPEMPEFRFAIENWFFGGSAFPAEYAPIAV